MSRKWFRNLPLKIGVAAAATAGTLGFYSLIQAHPLSHTTPATTSAPAANAAAAPLASSDNAQAQQAPLPQPVPIQRVSSGS